MTKDSGPRDELSYTQGALEKLDLKSEFTLANPIKLKNQEQPNIHKPDSEIFDSWKQETDSGVPELPTFKK